MRRIGGAAIAGLILAACGSLGPADAGVPIEQLDLDPRDRLGTLAGRPAGPHVEILAGSVGGNHLAVAVQRDEEGACMAVWRGSDGSTACGPLPGAEGPLGPAFGLVLPGAAPAAGDDPPEVIEIAGMVIPEVASLTAELDDGRRAAARLVSLDAARVAARAFILYLPGRSPGGSLVARAEDGSELGRLVFGTSQ